MHGKHGLASRLFALQKIMRPIRSIVSILLLALIFVGCEQRHETVQSSFPIEIGRGIAWSFSEPVPSSPSELIRAVAAYNAAMQLPFDRTLLATVTPLLKLEITYNYAIQHPSGKWEIKTATARIDGNNEALTYGDILWQFHRAAFEHLKNQDHKFFEGFYLVPASNNKDLPTYEVSLGS